MPSYTVEVSAMDATVLAYVAELRSTSEQSVPRAPGAPAPAAWTPQTLIEAAVEDVLASKRALVQERLSILQTVLAYVPGDAKQDVLDNYPSKALAGQVQAQPVDSDPVAAPMLGGVS